MKKLKTLLFASVPLWASIGIQLIIIYYMLFLAAIFLFGIAPAITGESHGVNDLIILASDMNFNAVASISFSVCCIAMFGIWYHYRCGGTFQVNIKKQFHPLEISGIILLIPGTQFFSSLFIGFISTIFPSWLEEYEELMEIAGMTGDIPLLMMIYSVLLAPISEELIFRGVALRIAKRAFPFRIANIIQALFFGIFHQNMLQGCYTFVIGLVLGYVCEKGGTIYHAVFFHFLFNLWGTTAADWLLVEDMMLQGMIILFGTLICLPVGFMLFRKGAAAKCG